MPKEIFNSLKKVWVSGQQLKISHLTKERNPRNSDNRVKNKRKGRKKDETKSKKK